ncbi:MAG: hypothetical protein AVDCRST_MAG64-3934, partial [uncultured Phycisphaerae bacterium]
GQTGRQRPVALVDARARPGRAARAVRDRRRRLPAGADDQARLLRRHRVLRRPGGSARRAEGGAGGQVPRVAARVARPVAVRAGTAVLPPARRPAERAGRRRAGRADRVRPRLRRGPAAEQGPPGPGRVLPRARRPRGGAAPAGRRVRRHEQAGEHPARRRRAPAPDR